MKQYLPKGVMNVVNNEGPELESNFENTVAPPSWARVCSTDGNMWRSRHTLLFNLTQILMRPSGLEITTIPAHQSVGVSTRVITPIFSILSSSGLTFGMRGMATLRGTVRAYGVGSSFKRMYVIGSCHTS